MVTSGDSEGNWESVVDWLSTCELYVSRIGRAGCEAFWASPSDRSRQDAAVKQVQLSPGECTLLVF